MRKRKVSVAERSRRSDEVDPDAVDFDAVDWERLEPVDLELDPSLVERIRARRPLRQITLRVGEEQIEEARKVASKTGLPYQAVLRRWLAEGASIARTRRLKPRTKPPRPGASR